MNQKTLAVYTLQKIDSYHVLAISDDIFQTLQLKDNNLTLIIKQDKVMLEGQRLQRRPSSSTRATEVATIALQ